MFQTVVILSIQFYGIILSSKSMYINCKLKRNNYIHSGFFSPSYQKQSVFIINNNKIQQFAIASLNKNLKQFLCYQNT